MKFRHYFFVGITLIFSVNSSSTIFAGKVKDPAQKIYAFGDKSEIIYDLRDFGWYYNSSDEDIRVKETNQKRIGDKGLSIQINGNNDSLVFTAPFTEIKPNKKYTLQVFILPENPSDDFKIWLMIRKYTSPQTRPLQPYSLTAVRDRGIRPQQINNWVLRSIDFTSQESASHINFSIPIQGKVKRLTLGGVRLLDSEKYKSTGWNAFQKTLLEIQNEAQKRNPLVERTLVFSRSQVKYGLERNYMRHWIDRPLFVDRSIQDASGLITSYQSFVKQIDIVKMYDIDGFAFFPETGRWDVFNFANKANVKDFYLLPEFTTTKNIEAKSKVIESAKQCESVIRINGKILITSYNAVEFTPAEWGEILKKLRDKHGDCFIFLPALTAAVRFKRDFQNKTPIFIDNINEDKRLLCTYADVCDGLYFHYPAALKLKDRTFDGEFYRELFIPIWKSVIAGEKYKNKYFGLSAYHSHSNPALSIGLEEDNTKTLRRSFEAAMDAKPDVINLPEWDEENENTCFRPTVYNSLTSQRIIRYYMSKIKHIDPTPNPNDDLSIPNLIISYRKILVLGEKMKIELLNVPDSKRKETYSVILTLKDEDNNTIETFEPAQFTTSSLSDKTFILPSEKYAKYRAIIPSLAINGYKGKDLIFDRGFHHINLRATWTWDFKYVKQPLRDLAIPKNSSFAMTGYDPKTGIMTVEGAFNCKEKIALAEVLEEDDVVYAVDPADEFYRGSKHHVLLWIEYRSLYYGANKIKTLNGKIKIVNGSGKWFSAKDRYQSAIYRSSGEGRALKNTFELKSPVSSHVRGVLVAIPKKDAENALLDFDFNILKTKIPVKKITEKDIYSEEFDGIILTVFRYFKLPDMPFHLNQNACTFTAQVRPEMKTSLIHMRITTKSGKTFRSAPLLVPNTTSGVTEKLRIYSDVEGKAKDIVVEKIRIPDLFYGFNDERGTIFHTDAGRPFWGQLGGFIDTSTGRGGNGGNAECLFSHANAQQYPDNVKNSAPKWVQKDGSTSLQFDGFGNFIMLPRESLPRHSSFKLSFELMPLSKKNQYLFICGRGRSSLVLYIKDGKLGGYYTVEGHKRYKLDTDLDVPHGKWSKIELIYDFENIQLSVNNEKRTEPCKGPGNDLGGCGFGGFGKTKEDKDYGGNRWWFEGYLRSFRIVHNSH